MTTASNTNNNSEIIEDPDNQLFIFETEDYIFRHHSKQLLEHIYADCQVKIPTSPVLGGLISYRNLYLLHVATPVEQLKGWIWNDISLSVYDDRNLAWDVVKQFLDEHDLKIPKVNESKGYIGDFRANGYISDLSAIANDRWEPVGNQSADFIRFSEFLEREWGKLDDQQQTVATDLLSTHYSVFLSWLLVTGRCSPPQYALLILNSLGQEPLDDFGEGTEWNQSHYAQYLSDANICVEYLRLCENPIKAIIEGGETKTVEFKSSFRWSLVEGKNSKEVETASLKTMVAFMNSGGGTLVIGVNDARVPIGVKHDGYKNHDTYKRALGERVRKRIGPEFLNLIHMEFITMGRQEILALRCMPAVHPNHAYLDGDLYIRQGPESRRLTSREAIQFERGLL